MEITGNISFVCDEIVKRFAPDKIILFNSKQNVSGETKSFKVCIIKATENKDGLERQIYLNIESEIPFDVLIYTPDEWFAHCETAGSFARLIKHKGSVIYEKA